MEKDILEKTLIKAVKYYFNNVICCEECTKNNESCDYLDNMEK